MIKTFGLELIRLDLPFRLNHVNCFLAEGEDGYTIIDTGLNNEYTKKRWEELLQGKEVTNLFITHSHPDHFGYAGHLQTKTGAKVSMAKKETEIAQRLIDRKFLQDLAKNYKQIGVPLEEVDRMVRYTKSHSSNIGPFPKVDQFFEEGDTVKIGKYMYEVMFTPGHSDGLIVFYCAEKSILIATDHILPKITPNISYWFHGDPNPLATYLHSLEKMKQLQAEVVIPSHGRPFTDANKRIEQIKKHHDERLEKMLKHLTEARTAYEMSRRLFPNIETVHEIRFAIGETIAHLEYLRLKKEIKKETINGKILYYK